MIFFIFSSPKTKAGKFDLAAMLRHGGLRRQRNGPVG
jgi:hypothetical protein